MLVWFLPPNQPIFLFLDIEWIQKHGKLKTAFWALILSGPVEKRVLGMTITLRIH